MNYYSNKRTVAALAAMALAGHCLAADPAPAQTVPAQGATAASAGYSSSKRCTSVRTEEPAYVKLGKSTVIPLSFRVVRIVGSGQPQGMAPRPPAANAQAQAALQSLGVQMVAPAAPPPPTQANDGVADIDIMLLSPSDLFFRGKNPGTMNVVLQAADGACFVKDIVVTIDPEGLQSTLAELMPQEKQIKVRGADRSLILTGEVRDATNVDEIMRVATSFGEGRKVVNLMRVTAPQQVMLEVTIAEVSKLLLDKLGSRLALTRTSDGGLNTYNVFSNFLSNGGGLIDALRAGRTRITLDGQKDDGLVRVLAEPNIMAISGQQASFLSGGKIFIPVAQSSSGGALIVTLEEKEFGIGVKFTPTVLDNNRVNLKMVSEVSDLSQVGSPFTTINGVTSVIPSFTVRRADTTVQLGDGQSFVVAGLIKNNVNETVKRYPGLGEVPVIGALARSTEFQTDQSELLFVITPRLVKPLSEAPRLPTDNHVVPTRAEVYFNGALESSTPPADAPPPEFK